MRSTTDGSGAMAAELATDLRDKAAAYLKEPYARLVIPETDGTFRGEILEFPGCIATGDTSAEALGSLEDVASAWLQSALANNQPIPPTARGLSGASANAGSDGDLSVLLRGNRLEITADVDRAGLERLKEVLGKYEEILNIIDPPATGGAA